MRRTTAKGILFASVAIAALSGSAEAVHFHGWYVGLEGGFTHVEDLSQVSQFATANGFERFNSESQFDVGWAVLATTGYAFDNNWRLEGEFGYRSNNLDKAHRSNSQVTDVGDMHEYSLMANLLYDLQIAPTWSLSLGFGLGADDVSYKLDSVVDDSHVAFAYQGIVGVNKQIGKQLDFFVTYRYLRVAGDDFTSKPGIVIEADDIAKDTFTIGLRYDLQADPEPVAAAPAPAPMAPPPAPSHFIVFFGFNKCNITAEADAVLSEAAAAAKSTGAASVRIVGHTDTSGSMRYNQKLSECRADAAKSNLVGKGISANAIATSGKGETELMVQTGDGVKEPQNRRATVDLN